MKRKLILLSVALVLILGAMGLYLAYSGPQGSGPARRHVSEIPTTQLDRSPMTPVLGTEVGVGKDIKVPLFQDFTEKDPATGRTFKKTRQVGRVEADESRMLAPGRFHLVRPRFWNYMKDGRTVYLESETADFLATEAAALSLNPKHGTLTGSVFLVIDRNTRPDRPPPNVRPWDTVRIRMDRVEFDYTDNLIQTESVLRAESFEADIDSRGLVLRWDPVTRQIVDLRLNTDGQARPGRDPFIGRMVVRQGLELVGAEEPPAGPEGQPPPAGPRPGPTTRPRSLPDPAKVQTYLATFHQDVEILQGYDPANPETFEGKLFSDRTVSAIFDFTAPKEETISGGATKAAPARPTPQPAAPPTAPPSDLPQEAVLITWRGLLTMVPKDRSDEADRIVTGMRRELIAEGENVILLQNDGRTATCLKLAYDTETRIARLFGTAERRVTVVEPEGRRLECESLLYDELNRHATLIGSGLMLARTATDQDQPDPLAGLGASARRPAATTQPAVLSADDPSVVAVQWRRQVEVRLAGPRERAGPRPVAGRVDLLGGGAILTAEFEGAVRMRQGPDYRVSAETMTVDFMEPSPTVRANQIKQVRAEGRRQDGRCVEQVRIVRKAERAGSGPPPGGGAAENDVACDRLMLDMKPLADGTTVPDRATAIGAVVATQDTNRITAERMELQFAPRPAPPDKPAARPEYAPQEVQAFKNVIITNDQQGLKATGDHLASLLGSDKATLSGQPARAQLADRMIEGAIIEIDQKTQSAKVLGGGALAFKSDRELSGEPVTEPVLIRATWGLSMTYDGPADLAELRGDVRAASGRSYLQGDLVRLYLQEPPKPATAPDLAKATTTRPETQPEDLFQERLAGRQLKRLVAEKNVVALTSQTDPQTSRLLTRARITASQLIFDGETRLLEANGTGSLLLEDYRPAPPAKPAAAGGSPRAMRPSQTAFAWTRQMKFDPQTSQASFDGTVRMGHRGPGELVLGEDGSVAVNPRGRPVTLNCQNLLVAFVAAPQRPAGADLAAQGDSIQDVRSVRAAGGVYMTEGERSLTGELLFYEKDPEGNKPEMLILDGGPGKDARIDRVDPRGAGYTEFLAPSILWNRTTGEIRTARTRFQGSPPR